MQKQEEKKEEKQDVEKEKKDNDIKEKDSSKNEKKKQSKVKEEKPKKQKESKKKKETEAEEIKEEEKKELVEKQKEEYEEKQKKRKSKIKIAIIVGVILLLVLIFSIIFSVININNKNIFSGISINGIEVSGLSKEDAKGKIQSIIDENKKKEIILKYNEFETQINPELIDVNYGVDDIVDNAYNTGRDNNIFVNNYTILFTMLGKKDIKVSASINEDELKKIITDASSKMPGAIQEASYYKDNDNLIITKGKKGLIIDIDDTIKQIKENLNDINKKNQDVITIKVIEKDPEKIDIDKIYAEVHQEPKDAYFVKEPFQIFPEVNGVDFNLEEAKKLINEEKDEYTIKLNISKPQVTLEQIGKEAFPDRLAIFTTRYDASNVNRTVNLRLACEKINGTVLLSGETFSYNKVLGERTIAAGYREAAIYSAGQVVDGLGGGICQISSTLYNAVVMANLEVVERRNHQFVTSYLPAGRDATVVYGVTDFQFKNTRKYPVRIVAYIQNGIATMEIYGLKEENEYSAIEFETKTVGTTPFSTKYIDDNTLETGKEVVTQKGAIGLQTETYVIKYKDGKATRELLSKDTYTPMQRIVKRGTKAVAQPTQPAQQNQPVQPVQPTTTTNTQSAQQTKPTPKTNTQSVQTTKSVNQNSNNTMKNN